MSRKTRSSDSTRNSNKSSFLQDLQRQAIAWAAVEASKDAYGRPDPYVAGGLAAGMGMTSLEDSVHLGAMLGAEGAFSSSSSSRRRRSSYCDEDTSWREFCEDGSEYGLDPEDFDDELEYEEALEEARSAWHDKYEPDFEHAIYPEDYDTEEEYLEALDEAKHAWRDDCDGDFTLDIYPEDYETEEEFLAALEEAQNGWREGYSPEENFGLDPEDYDSEEEYLDAVEEEKCAWRDKYEDDFEFDLYPEDFETEQEYLSAKAKLPNRSAYKNERQYEAAVCLWEIEHGNRDFSNERERRDQILRCQFILNHKDVLAAKYLTTDGEFQLVEAVYDHWDLPAELNRKADKEYIGNLLYQLLNELSDIDISLTLDVWCWCVEQFHPYRQFEKEPGAAAEAIHMKQYLHTDDEFSLALLERIVKDPGLVSVIFSTELHPNSMVKELVPLAVKNGQIETAKQIMDEYLRNENVPSEVMCKSVFNLLIDCSEPGELEDYELFVDEVFSIIRACKIPKVQRSIPKWEKQIADHIEYEETHSEKYAYSRRYAWRTNYPDGKTYGVDPLYYDTEEEYLPLYNQQKELYEREQKYGWRKKYRYDRTKKVSPYDFETEEEFLAADAAKKSLWRDDYALTTSETGVDPEDYESEADYLYAVRKAQREKAARNKPAFIELDSIADRTIYTFCGVVYKYGSNVYHYRTDDETLAIGDKVIVPVGPDNKGIIGEIVSVEKHMRLTAPFPVEKTKFIIGRYVEAKEE